MSESREPQVVEVPEQQRYELRIGDEVVGVIGYRQDGQVLDLVHTEIEPDHEGEGLGSRIAAGVFDDVRRRGMKIRPTCPFIGSYLERHPDDRDLVAE